MALPIVQPASTRWLTVVWVIALVLLPIQTVSMLPWLQGRVQPPDLAVLVLAVGAGLTWWRAGWPRLAPLDVAAAWPVAMGAVLLGTGHARTPLAVLEVVGASYLLLAYLVVRLIATPKRIDLFFDWYPASIACAAIVGLVGVTAAAFGTQTSFASPMAAVLPYLGPTARAQAMTPGPQMLASLLLVAIPIAMARAQLRGWTPGRRVTVLLLGLGLLATQSKTIVCVVVALAVMAAVAGRRRRLAIGVAVAAAVTFLAVTHVVVTPERNVPALEGSQVLAGAPWKSFVWGGEIWVVAPTTYVANKAASLGAIGERWPIGLGPVQQAAYTAARQSAGRYPTSIRYPPFMEPHSTYLGTAAELGLAGVAAGLLMVGAGFWTLRRWVRQRPGDWTAAAVCGIFAGVLLEATATDLMNGRHYWWLMAVVASARHQER
jgi:hypothetical protein